MTESRKRKIELVAEIKAIHGDPKLRVYGSPRMTRELNARGFDVAENTVARLVAENAVVAKGARTFRPPRTTTPDPNAKYSPNLIRDKVPSRFGEVLVSDITYIPTKEGWLFLAVVIDLYSRQFSAGRFPIECRPHWLHALSTKPSGPGVLIRPKPSFIPTAVRNTPVGS